MTDAAAITPARTEADFDAVVVLGRRLGRGPATLEELEHVRATVGEPIHVLAMLGGEPVGFAYAGIWPGTEGDRYLQAELGVLPERRRLGIGSALLRAISEHARSLGAGELQFEVSEDDPDALAYLGRRGFREVERQMQVVLDLGSWQPPDDLPPGDIDIVTRAQRPDLLPQMHAVGIEAGRDVPGTEGGLEWTFDEWKAWEIDRPSNLPDLCFVALHGPEVVGYALLQAFDPDVYHGFTAVKREWRRHGVGRALTLRQIAAAKAKGYQRLYCESEERNLPMRRLCESLGYQPLPAVVVLRGLLA